MAGTGTPSLRIRIEPHEQSIEVFLLDYVQRFRGRHILESDNNDAIRSALNPS